MIAGPQNCTLDITTPNYGGARSAAIAPIEAIPVRTSKHLEFRIELPDEIELSDGGCYGVSLTLDIGCNMDGRAVESLRDIGYHHVADWKITVGPIELTGISRENAEAIFRDFYSVAKNRERVLQLCRAANSESN